VIAACNDREDLMKSMIAAMLPRHARQDEPVVDHYRSRNGREVSGGAVWAVSSRPQTSESADDLIRSIRADDRHFSHDPSSRGYHAVYREREKNFCPGCGRTHWWLGRFSAECVYCGTALPLTDALLSGRPLHVRCAGSTASWE
jgi:hypothetical protein